jgi:hypothetical protein
LQGVLLVDHGLTVRVHQLLTNLVEVPFAFKATRAVEVTEAQDVGKGDAAFHRLNQILGEGFPEVPEFLTHQENQDHCFEEVLAFGGEVDGQGVVEAAVIRSECWIKGLLLKSIGRLSCNFWLRYSTWWGLTLFRYFSACCKQRLICR